MLAYLLSSTYSPFLCIFIKDLGIEVRNFKTLSNFTRILAGAMKLSTQDFDDIPSCLRTH